MFLLCLCDQIRPGAIYTLFCLCVWPLTLVFAICNLLCRCHFNYIVCVLFSFFILIVKNTFCCPLHKYNRPWRVGIDCCLCFIVIVSIAFLFVVPIRDAGPSEWPEAPRIKDPCAGKTPWRDPFPEVPGHSTCYLQNTVEWGRCDQFWYQFWHQTISATS